MPSTTQSSNTAPPPYTPSDDLSMKSTAKSKTRFSLSSRRISSETMQTDTSSQTQKAKTQKKQKPHVNKEPFYAAAYFHCATR